MDFKPSHLSFRLNVGQKIRLTNCLASSDFLNQLTTEAH